MASHLGRSQCAYQRPLETPRLWAAYRSAVQQCAAMNKTVKRPQIRQWEFIGPWAVIDLETPRRTDLHHIGALDRPSLIWRMSWEHLQSPQNSQGLWQIGDELWNMTPWDLVYKYRPGRAACFPKLYCQTLKKDTGICPETVLPVNQTPRRHKQNPANFVWRNDNFQ